MGRLERSLIAAEDADHLAGKAARVAEEVLESVRHVARELGWSEASTEAFGKAVADAVRG